MYPKRSKIKFKLNLVSLNITLEDGETELCDVIGEEQEEFCNVEDSIYYQELKAEMYNVMTELLDDRSKRVLIMYYGLESKKSTQSEIADVLGVSLSYVGQIIKKSRKRIRNSSWGKLYESERQYEMSCR